MLRSHGGKRCDEDAVQLRADRVSDRQEAGQFHDGPAEDDDRYSDADDRDWLGWPRVLEGVTWDMGDLLSGRELRPVSGRRTPA